MGWNYWSCIGMNLKFESLQQSVNLQFFVYSDLFVYEFDYGWEGLFQVF